MTIWILSPNVHNDSTENEWKDVIRQSQRAYIGYNTDHRYGELFGSSIQIGDVILIAQGQNTNKRLFLCGEVISDARWEHLPETPGLAQNRCLQYVLNQNELNNLGLDFTGSKWGDSKQPATLYDLTPDQNTQDAIIYQRIIRRIADKKRELMLQPIIQLLKYKKQIILQGPPGTGKTKLAKEIASAILTKTITKTSLDTIKDYLTEHQISDEVEKWRNIRVENRDDFMKKFPVEKLSDLTLEDYCIGQPSKDNFCWWIERGLESFGRYAAGNSINYHVYFSKDDQEFRTLKRYIDAEDAIKHIQVYLSDIVEETFNRDGLKCLGDGYILKLLATYRPEKYVQIYKHENLVKIASILKIDSKSHFLELNRSIKMRIDELVLETSSNMDVDEVIHYLYRTFLGGNDSQIHESENQIIISSKPTIVQFHPSFGYEDFVRGITAEELNGSINYKVQNKTLADLARKALEDKENDYVLIIDEINRANLSSVLGELIYALEYRGEPVDSMYALKDSQENEYELIIPPNLYIIGTMNTADRSVGVIDYAIRRRFAFVTVPAKNLSEEGEQLFASELFEKVASLFEDHCSKEFNKDEVQLGHSYFIDKSTDLENPVSMDIRWQYEIKPILLEYVKDGILIGEHEGLDVKAYIENDLK